MENRNIIIERIDISAFGRLSALSLCPTEGINLLECANERGKSTVAAFIKFVLYGFKGRVQSIIDNPKKLYLPWSGAPACGSLTLSVDGRKIRIERSATASTEKCTCTDLQSGAKLYDGLCPGEEIFGVGVELFEKSAFFACLTRPENKDEGLAKSLQGLFTTSDTADEAGDAVKLLTKQKNALQGKAGAGEIPALEKRLIKLTDTLERELSGADEKKALETELETISKTAAAREADMERLGVERENAERYDAFLALEEHKRLVSDRDTAAANAASWEGAVPSEEDIKNYKELNKEAMHFAATAEAEEKAAEQAKKKKAKKANAFLAATVAFAIAAGALAAFKMWIYAGAALAVAALLCVLFIITKSKSKAEVLSDTMADYEKAKAALDSAMAQYGGSADSFDTDIERMTDNMHEAEMLRVVLEEKEKSLAAFEARNNIEELKARAEGAEKPKREKNKIEFEYQFALRSAMGLRQKESEKKSRLAVLSADGADISATETELFATREALEKAKKRYTALCLAIEGLNDAEDELRSNVVPRLAALTAKLFARMTGGKYDNLELDNKLFMSFESDYGMKSAEHLSAGTREGLYLCMRLALLHLIYGESNTPIVLDDAFSKQDNERLSAMLSLLCEEGRQCLVLCCTDRERKALDSIGKEYNTLNL